MTDFKNLAQLSSDALLVVARGCIAYANPAAHALMAPAAGAQGLHGLAVPALWLPDPLQGAWASDDPPPPVTVQLQAGHSPVPGIALELIATRDQTPEGPVYYVKARHLQAGSDMLAERVRTALAVSTDAAMVVDAQTLAFLDANPAACALMGLTLEAVRKRGPATMRRRDGSGQEDFHALYAQLIEHSPRALTHEYDFLAEDGRTIPIAATRQALNVDGRWLIFITWRDISAQVSAQALVQQFKDSFDQTPDATNIIDVQTLSYVYVNEPFIRLMGLPRERVLSGGPLSMPKEIVVVDDLAAFLASVVAHHPQSLVREKTVTLPDGQQATFESHHQAVFSGGRWLVRATRVDITQRKQQQRHLHRVMAAVDAAVDAIFIIDPVTMGYVEVNEAAALLFETPRQTLRTLRVPDLMPRLSAPFSSDELAAHYRALIRQAPQPMTNEIAVHQAGGRQVPVENVRRAVQVNGEWLIVSVMRDISARKQAQLQLELLKAAFNAAPDAIMVFDPITWEYVDVNEAAAQLYGVPREQMISAGIAGASHQDDATRDYLKQIYAKVIAQSPLPDTDVRRLVRTDGYQPMIEATRRAMCVDGRWLIVSVNRDITERKAAQARQELLTAAIEAAPDGIAVVDPVALQYLHVNEAVCRTHAASREQLMQLGVDGMFRDQLTPDAIRALYQSVIDSYPGATSQERAIVALDGSTTYYEAVRRAVQVDGRWLIISMNRDVTERKAAQARIERFAAVLNLSADAVMLVDRASMRIIDVNEAACRMHGYSRDELLALPPHLSRDGTTLEQLAADYDEAIRQSPAVVHSELKGRRADGGTFIAEVQRQALRQAVDGGWIIAITVRDITERKNADARLNMLRAAIDLAPDAFFLIDPQAMEYIDVNRAAGAMYGLTREQVLSLGLLGYVRQVGLYGHDEAPARLQEDYAAVIAQYPKPQVLERTVRLPGRDLVYNENVRKAVPLDGRWLIVSVTRDITERKRQQARMERFAAVLNMSADAVLFYDRKRMAIVDVNEAACRMYGYSREAFLALPPHKGREGLTQDGLATVFDQVIAASPQVVRAEIVALRQDGSTFAAEAHRQALYSDDGWLVVASVRDITERKRAEIEIRQRVAELELLREAYDAAVDAILIADPETLGYYDVNQAAVKLLGVSREDLLARGVEASYYSTAGEPFDAERFRKGSRYVISRAPEVLVEVRTVNPLGLGGRDTVIEFSRRAVNIDNRWVIVTLMRDITAAHRAEEEIRQRVAELTRSNQELEQFAYVTSHDLSEPLRMVASYTQLLSRRYADKFDDDGREFIKYAVDGAQRMKQLIDDLLMYSRAGRSKVPMRHIRLDRSLDDALANLANAIERNGATIERSALPELVCEKAGLTQVFQNLVGNAIKFRGEAAPVVRISAVQDEHFWTISVADNGIGIAPEYFQRIFIIFQRLHARTKYEGTGIGLSICKKIVERHGGQITVASEPGQGTTFSFTLSRSLTESESP